MQCTHVHDLMSEYVSGSTNRALTITVENHLAECPACKEIADGMRRLWTSLDQLPSAEPPLFFHANMMARIDAATAQVVPPKPARTPWDLRSLLRPRALALGSAALILLLAGLQAVHSTSQLASLDPLGWVTRLFHAPAAPPALSVGTVEWLPRDATGGELRIRLRGAPKAGGATRILYAVTAPVGGSVLATGVMTSDADTVLSLAAPIAPHEGDSVRIELQPLDGGGSSVSISLPIHLLPVGTPSQSPDGS